MFPVVRIPTFGTKVNTFENGSEQRWMDRRALYSFNLAYSEITKTDKNNLNDFLFSVLGGASTWTFNWFNRGAVSTTAAPYNGNFENSLSGWGFTGDAGWTAYTTGVSYDGSNAAVIQTNSSVAAANGTSAGRIQSSSVAIVPGQPVTVSFWVATNPTGTPNPSGVTSGAQCRINCLAADGTLLSQYDPGVIILSGTGWQQINFSTSTPGATAYVELILFGFIQNLTASAYTGTCTIIFDNVNITGTNSAYLYTNCVFDDDSFDWTENQEGQWSGEINFHQVAAGGAATARYKGSFPGIGPSGNQVTGFPFTSSAQFSTLMNDMQTGARVSYAQWGAGRPGFPSRPLKRWTLPLTTLNDADLITLEGHFIGCGGKYRTFAFTDPETQKHYTSVRYDMDQLKITHVDYGISSATVQLIETYGQTWTA